MAQPDPYRDSNASALQAFAQHVAIAETCLEDIVPLAKRFELSLAFASAEVLSELASRLGNAWEALWQQLDQARNHVVEYRRDVTLYDVARASVGDRSAGAVQFDFIYYHPTSFLPHQLVTYRKDDQEAVLWIVPPPQPARDAIEALRAAVPEVVIPRSPPSTESALPWSVRRGGLVLWCFFVGTLLAILGLLVAYSRH